MAQATLINPDTGERVAVQTGTQQAQNYFGQGYVLETSYNQATGQSTWDTTPAGGGAPTTGGYQAPPPSVQQQLDAYTASQPSSGFQQFGTDFQEMWAAQQAALEQARQATIGGLESQEAEAVRRTRDVGGRQAGSMRRLLGRAGGFTTTAGAQAMEAQNSRLEEEVSRLGMAKSDAIAQANAAFAQGNADLAGQAFNTMFQITSAIESQQQQMITNFLKMQQEQRAQRMYDPSDLLDIAQTLAVGQTQIITDPGTGEEFTVQGIGSNDATIKAIASYDAAGNLTISAYRMSATGLELIDQIDAGQVGKPGPSGGGVMPNITVITDPTTGIPTFIQTTNRADGTILYTDLQTGDEVDPADVTIDPPPPEDPFDVFINDIMSDLNLGFDLE